MLLGTGHHITRAAAQGVAFHFEHVTQHPIVHVSAMWRAARALGLSRFLSVSAHSRSFIEGRFPFSFGKNQTLLGANMEVGVGNQAGVACE